jgi:hypothetical protein
MWVLELYLLVSVRNTRMGGQGATAIPIPRVLPLLLRGYEVHPRL